MDSGTRGNSSDDVNWRRRCRWTENSKVYTRRIHKKAPKPRSNNYTPITTTSNAESPGSAAATSENPTTTSAPTKVSSPTAVSAATYEVSTPSNSKDPDDSAAGDYVVPESLENLASQDADSSQQRVGEQSPQAHCGSQNAEFLNREDSPLTNSNEARNLKKPTSDGRGPQNSDDVAQKFRGLSPLSGENGFPNGREVAAPQFPFGNESQNDGQLTSVSPLVPSGDGLANVNGSVEPLVISKVDDRVRFKLAKATHKDDINELKEKLDSELDQVVRLVKQLEAKELQLALYNSQITNSNNLNNISSFVGTKGGNIGGHSYSQPRHAESDLVDRRVNSEIRPTQPYNRQLSVAVMENNHRVNEYVEKEKRTPKANQYYRNSEFLLGKDKLPSESVKRLKTYNGRKRGFGFGLGKSRKKLFKSCSSLLQRLMKHKLGWVFNEPVDAKELGLVDYHDIIKHPMDLGTIKTRLSQNWYKSPREFAEDVRLVFRNAMTYNPKGQDVHIMAQQLLQVFEERWAATEAKYNSYGRYQIYPQAQSHFAPVSDVPIPLYAPASARLRTLGRQETMTTSMAVNPKVQRPHVSRAPVPKKPKAKDPNKRDMTHDEKQRLSTNLQSLPSEKLDAIVQIIKRRSTALSQHDNEIEVDIDNVDAEILWELDRFVTNYKKCLSKNKRKAELALQARPADNQTVALTNTTTAVADGRIDSGAAFEKKTAPPAVEGENQGYNGRSSSSSSSGSDSRSSSSDSDSDSSTANRSDAGH